jgi:hypothetical protein
MYAIAAATSPQVLVTRIGQRSHAESALFSAQASLPRDLTIRRLAGRHFGYPEDANPFHARRQYAPSWASPVARLLDKTPRLVTSSVFARLVEWRTRLGFSGPTREPEAKP